MKTRREFLKNIIAAIFMLAIGRDAKAEIPVKRKGMKDSVCTLYRVVNGSSAENLSKVISLIGGIEKLISSDDVVMIKPNVQWWNQGAPNLSALKTFIDLIMNRPGGFNGEVAIAENCHRGSTPWNSAGWGYKFKWNSDLKEINNMNDLCNLLKKQYRSRFSTCHWIDVDAGNRRVFGPEDGTGYVYCDGTGGVPLFSYDNGLQGDNYRAVIMTYPIFETDKGTIVDFKNGIWEKGNYTDQPLKFINFAALNHHSTYCGVTSAVKNYLGISDLSGGPDPYNGGRSTKDYCNFHSFPFNKWSPGPREGMIGAEIAVFMNTIRKADLNITTAEWIGFASRTMPPMARTRAVLACTDPVALDYHAAKYLLFPNSRIPLHDPDDKKGPLHQYLAKCAEEVGGTFDERYVDVKSFDFKTGSFQGDEDLVVMGEKTWGKHAKTLTKYVVFRYLADWY